MNIAVLVHSFKNYLYNQQPLSSLPSKPLTSTPLKEKTRAPLTPLPPTHRTIAAPATISESRALMLRRTKSASLPHLENFGISARSSLASVSTPTPTSAGVGAAELLREAEVVAEQTDAGPGMIGLVGIRGRAADGRLELGYTLHPDFQGRRLGTEAVRAWLGLYWGLEGMSIVAYLSVCTCALEYVFHRSVSCVWGREGEKPSCPLVIFPAHHFIHSFSLTHAQHTLPFPPSLPIPTPVSKAAQNKAGDAQVRACAPQEGD
jgi:hypothetical protein